MASIKFSLVQLEIFKKAYFEAIKFEYKQFQPNPMAIAIG